MWIKNGNYKIETRNEFHNIPKGYKTHKNKMTTEEKKNMIIECNLDWFTLFVMILVGLSAPLSPWWKTFIIAGFIIKCFSIKENEK